MLQIPYGHILILAALGLALVQLYSAVNLDLLLVAFILFSVAAEHVSGLAWNVQDTSPLLHDAQDPLRFHTILHNFNHPCVLEAVWMMYVHLAGTSVRFTHMKWEPTAAMVKSWRNWSKRGGGFPLSPLSIHTNMRLQTTYLETKLRFTWIWFQLKQDLPQ